MYGSPADCVQISQPISWGNFRSSTAELIIRKGEHQEPGVSGLISSLKGSSWSERRLVAGGQSKFCYGAYANLEVIVCHYLLV